MEEERLAQLLGERHPLVTLLVVAVVCQNFEDATGNETQNTKDNKEEFNFSRNLNRRLEMV